MLDNDNNNCNTGSLATKAQPQSEKVAQDADKIVGLISNIEEMIGFIIPNMNVPRDTQTKEPSTGTSTIERVVNSQRQAMDNLEFIAGVLKEFTGS